MFQLQYSKGCPRHLGQKETILPWQSVLGALRGEAQAAGGMAGREEVEVLGPFSTQGRFTAHHMNTFTTKTLSAFP